MSVRAGLLAGIGIAALLLGGGCGPKRIAVGTVPFPAEKPVFTDNTGARLSGFPDFPEPARLVLLDFPWCPPCRDAWSAIRKAAAEVPPGSIRVVRILFDRERSYGAPGSGEVPPLAAPPPADAGPLSVYEVTALPGPFRKQFRVEQAPLLLLLDRKGNVVKRWVGSSPSLAGAIVSEVSRLLSASPLPET